MKSIFGSAFLGDRENQEDDFSFVMADERRMDSTVLVVLCDGMGGHAGGEVASSTAVKAFRECFEADNTTDPQQRLLSALEAANRSIGDKVRANAQLEGMGSTLIGAIKLPKKLVWVSVGDSHVYLFRNGKMAKLNADHSLFSELLIAVKKGEMTLDEARANPRRNALISAVMGRDIALIDQNQIGLREGDLIVFASDGLDSLPNDRIEQLLREHYGATPEEVTEGLLAAVREARKPRQDNTTVVALYHTTKTYPFWKEATRWSMSQPTRRTARSKWLGLGLVGVLGAMILAGLALVFATGQDAVKTPITPKAVVAPSLEKTPEKTPEKAPETTPEKTPEKTPDSNIGSVTQTEKDIAEPVPNPGEVDPKEIAPKQRPDSGVTEPADPAPATIPPQSQSVVPPAAPTDGTVPKQ